MTTPLRPLSTGELLDRTFTLYRSHFPLFVGIIALPHLVLLAFQLAGIAIRPTTGSIPLAIGSILWSLLTAVVYLGVAGASQGATVIAVSRVHLERPVGVVEAFSPIRNRIPALAGILIAVGLAIMIGLLLLIVPGVFLALMWALTIPVAVLENKGLTDAVSRSAELTKGDRGRIFLIFILFAVLIWAVSAVIQLPVLFAVGAAARGNPQAILGWPQVAIVVAGFVTQCLVGPLLTIALSLIYYDERVRKEAFDLQHMMATLDIPRAGAASAT